jgi:hypothetical protein
MENSAVEYLFTELEMIEKNWKTDCIEYTDLKKITFEIAKYKEIEQQDEKINKAIAEFERLKNEAKSFKDAVYLDGVLAVLKSIKNEKK